MGEDFREAEKELAVDKLPGKLGVGLCRLSDSTHGKVTGDGQPAARRIDRHRAAAEGLPAQGESANGPSAARETSEGNNSDGGTAARDQAQRRGTNADGRNGQSTAGKQHADGTFPRSDPGLDWWLRRQTVKPDMDEGQSEEFKLAAIFPA